MFFWSYNFGRGADLQLSATRTLRLTRELFQQHCVVLRGRAAEGWAGPWFGRGADLGGALLLAAVANFREQWFAEGSPLRGQGGWADGRVRPSPSVNNPLAARPSATSCCATSVPSCSVPAGARGRIPDHSPGGKAGGRVGQKEMYTIACVLEPSQGDGSKRAGQL